MESEPNWVKELRAQMLLRQDPWVVLEGRHAVEAAVAGWWDLSGILTDENCEWEAPEWSGLDVLRWSKDLFDELPGDAYHQGVLGLARVPDETANVAALMAELDSDAVVIVCPRVSSGEQAGMILRNAAALGAQAVIFGKEGASPFEVSSVRASSGGIFRVAVRVADGGQILRCLKGAGFQLLGGSMGESSVPVERIELEPGRIALVVGSEDAGLGSFWKAACDSLVHVPSDLEAAPLDPGAASAVMMWEILRRRKEQAED